MSEPSNFSFGAPQSTSGTSSPSLFSGTSGSVLFGPTTSSAPSAGLFGNLGQNSNAPKPDENKSLSFGQLSEGSSGFSFGNIGKKPGENNSSPALGTPKPPPFAAASTGGGDLFGNKGNTSSNPFGSTTPAPPKSITLFGSTTPAGPPPSNSTGNTSGGGLFSSLGGQKSSTTPSLFGQKSGDVSSTTSTPAANPSDGANPSTGSNLFSKPPATSSAPTSNLFGEASGLSAVRGTSTSEQSEPSDTPGPFGNIGQPLSSGQSKPDGGPSLFGGFGKTPAAPSAAGTNTTASQPAPSLFSKPAEAPNGSAPFSFTQPGPTASDTQQSQPPTSVPPSNYQKPIVESATSSTPSAGHSFSGLFNKSNAPPATSAAAPSLFGLGGASASASAPTSTAGTPSTGPAPSLFAPKAPASTAGSTPVTSAGTAAPTPSLFAPKAPTTIADPAQTAAAPAPSLFAPKAPTSSANSAPPTTAGTAAPTATSAATQASGTAAAASAAPSSNLNASTAGPVPPSQSRLKNKTMDEILNRWATDLLKYQKEFKGQAEQIATWDQMLVENMAKISKLYIATANSEKQTSSIEMQLTTVENQQEELSSFLDRYEKEVDDMMGQGVVGGEGGLQGVDQERERTYKIAEKLSERLDEMGNDLTSMVEDINTASASLSKQFKSDEPISQIVRILNSHLTQLQAIDQGTQALQAKITKAQKSGRDLGAGYAAAGNGNGASYYGGDQGGAVEDFYRSYMGRR